MLRAASLAAALLAGVLAPTATSAAARNWAEVDATVRAALHELEQTGCDESEPLCALGRRTIVQSGLLVLVDYAACLEMDTACAQRRYAHGGRLIDLGRAMRDRLKRTAPPLLAEDVKTPGEAAAVDDFVARAIGWAQGEPCPIEHNVCVLGRLAALTEADQLARGGFALCQQKPAAEREACEKAVGLRLARVDRAARRVLGSIVERHGWIDAARWGAFGERSAWLIAQHADADPLFQARMLSLMKRGVEAGAVNSDNYAYLVDRVAVNTGHPQTYGTQGACRGEGAARRWTPEPMDDAAAVETRRTTLSMSMTFAQYQGLMDKLCRGEPLPPR